MTQTTVLNAKTNKILKSKPLCPIMGSVVDKDVGCSQIDFASAKFGLHLIDRHHNFEFDSVESILAEVTDEIVLNANVLDALLVNPHLIPEDWKGKKVYFLGTTYKHAHLPRYVRYMAWVEGIWSGFDDCLFNLLNSETLHAAVLVN